MASTKTILDLPRELRDMIYDLPAPPRPTGRGSSLLLVMHRKKPQSVHWHHRTEKHLAEHQRPMQLRVRRSYATHLLVQSSNKAIAEEIGQRHFKDSTFEASMKNLVENIDRSIWYEFASDDIFVYRKFCIDATPFVRKFTIQSDADKMHRDFSDEALMKALAALTGLKLL